MQPGYHVLPVPTVYRGTREKAAEAKKRANASGPPLFNLPENFKAKDMKPCTLYFLYYNVQMLNKVVVLISLKRGNVEALILHIFSYIYVPDTCNC